MLVTKNAKIKLEKDYHITMEMLLKKFKRASNAVKQSQNTLRKADERVKKAWARLEKSDFHIVAFFYHQNDYVRHHTNQLHQYL